MFALIAFNLTVLLVSMIYVLFIHQGIWYFGQAFKFMGVAILIGLVTGGIGYVIGLKAE